MKQQKFIAVGVVIEGDHQKVSCNLATSFYDWPASCFVVTLLVKRQPFYVNQVLSVFILSAADIQIVAHNTAVVLAASSLYPWKLSPLVLADIIAVDIWVELIPKETASANDINELVLEASQAKTKSLAEDGLGLWFHTHDRSVQIRLE